MSRIVALVGPTSAGKTGVALDVADRTGALVVSVDSMLVYRGMDIGTAKPSPVDLDRVPHAMVDVVDPEEEYSVARFQDEARAAIAAWDGPIVLAGGSGLHLRAIVDPLVFPPTDPELRRHLEAVPMDGLRDELLGADPAAARLVDLANPRRVVRAVEILRLTGHTPSSRALEPARRSVEEYEPVLAFRAFGMDPGPDLVRRVSVRTATMRRLGLLDEVAALRHRLGATASAAVGYRQLVPVVDGFLGVDEGFAEVERATLALARRQRTFFRRDRRITWLDPDDRSGIVGRLVAELEPACVS